MKGNRAILVDKRPYSKPVSEHEWKKIKIELYLPPSDIPQSILSKFEEQKDILILTFRYLNSETEKELFDREDIKLIVGEFSGKPLRIEIKNIKKEKIDQVKLTNIISEEIGKLIEQKIREVKGVREKTNLQITEEVLRTNAETLASYASQSA